MASATLIGALWHGKCPRCRKGDVFPHRLTRLSKFSVMNLECPHCGATFLPEPGFYFGAMFISYAFNVGIFIACGLFLYLAFDHPSDYVYVLVIALAALVLTPLNYRISRILWLHWFGGHSFDPRY